ncbi:hypothetical protein PNOK_0427700 [Pyrrhoderma noxium]|uniref:Uncharacterized protein n=1 Tax=Pyrrhoderma noxium TaxID=2282107 RepID=A0A286UIB1_9AGAM|nr:hypothetical protein PNOK_0427700 [Pyrrhoderma noxium]
MQEQEREQEKRGKRVSEGSEGKRDFFLFFVLLVSFAKVLGWLGCWFGIISFHLKFFHFFLFSNQLNPVHPSIRPTVYFCFYP